MCLPVNFFKIFKNTVFVKQPRTTASGNFQVVKNSQESLENTAFHLWKMYLKNYQYKRYVTLSK